MARVENNLPSKEIPRLISFKLCPFVQRIAIGLIQRGIKFELEYIELASPPGWFQELSPHKKVPLLQIGGEVLFDSVAINEYLEDVYSNKLHPQDPILRARDRAWIEYSNECTWAAFHLSVKKTDNEFNKVLEGLHKQLDYLEPIVEAKPYFRGSTFSLVDTSFAPLFQRLSLLDTLETGIIDNQRHPRVTRWLDALLETDSVKYSCVPDFSMLYQEMLWKRQGYISQYIANEFKRSNVEKSVY